MEHHISYKMSILLTKLKMAAVKLVLEDDMTAAEVSKELSIHYVSQIFLLRLLSAMQSRSFSLNIVLFCP